VKSGLKLASAFLLVGLLAAPAAADTVQVFSDYNTWEANTQHALGLNTVTFDGFAAPGSYYAGNWPVLNVGAGVLAYPSDWAAIVDANFNPAFNMGTSGGSWFYFNGASTTFVFPELETAIAFQVMLLGGVPGSVNVVFGGANGSAAFTVATGSGATFFGVGSGSGFTTLTVSSTSGPLLLDDITFGDDPVGDLDQQNGATAVPEPASLILFGTSCLGPAIMLRRRSRQS